MIIMSAGPTSISERVKKAFNSESTNPDLDPRYTQMHLNLCKKYSKALNTDCTSFIMLGEAMLGLDGACCSIIKPNDRVLVLSNGLFGAGFKDIAESYGADCYLYEKDFRHGIDVVELENFLREDNDFKVATLVHCETPTGVTNDIESICRLLNKYGIFSIVDSVSGVMGHQIDFDKFKVDCLIGGTQKCISAPPGLTLITLSDEVKKFILNRENIPGFYANFKNYLKEGEDFAFPYTMNDSLTKALDAAVDESLEGNFAIRHKTFADKVRRGLLDAGLELFALDFPSDTVTTFLTNNNVLASTILDKMYQRGFIISGSFGPLKDNGLRIGHMGNNISDENYASFISMLKNLQEVMEESGITLKDKIFKYFL